MAKLKENKVTYSFLATMDGFRINKDGDAKLTLEVSSQEVGKMASLAQFNNRLIQVACIVLPPDATPQNAENDNG